MNREEADSFRFMMRHFRREFELTQADLAIAMKVNRHSIQKIESGGMIPWSSTVESFFAVKEMFERNREMEEMGMEGLS